MPPAVIEIHGLEKHYGSVPALAALDLCVAPGPVGLLGPNGAGKTTLIKLLLGLLVPDAGSARIAGHDPATPAGRHALRRDVGYMPESDCLVPGLSAVELVTTLGRLSGLGAIDALTRAHEVLDYVGLDESRYRPADGYSTGMKQRLKLAQALVHDPALLLLDEPTNGLDPKGRKHMLELVFDLGHAQGKNILLCSHLLPDVERTCSDVVVLQKGRAVLSGSIAELTGAHARRRMVELAGDTAAFAAELARAGLAASAAGEHALTVELPTGAEDSDGLFVLAAACGARITRIAEERSSLEQVFLDGLGGPRA
ncbi:MAG: ABC transporter ATP-binding protein [Planctomycetes bacterium]|nr:ABC transporter ATP-binding protein [Planctomycetota bacterium]